MSTNTGTEKLVARTWRGAVREQDLDAYIQYLHETGFDEYTRTPGNRGLLALSRIEDGRAELLLLTLWESRDAIRAFAGDDIDRAVFYPRDDEFLIDRDERVLHYNVLLRR
ncbi:MAG TPA: hypothetical protein VMU84_01060 [Thermoanaerobaculia bacterium]|nr:hypothetical protein [Thermoanaerobaculia bacterium]